MQAKRQARIGIPPAHRRGDAFENAGPRQTEMRVERLLDGIGRVG